MRFHFGSVPDDFTPDESWRPLREPRPFMMQLMAVPMGLLLGAMVWQGREHLGLPVLAFMEADPGVRTSGLLALTLPPLIAVHELIHVAVHPGFGLTPASVIGGWPKKLVFYAHYAGPRSRNRFLLGVAMPFLVISVLPMVLAAFGLMPKALSELAPWLSACKALFSCGDAFGFAMILWQVPGKGWVQNKSWRTYWRVS